MSTVDVSELEDVELENVLQQIFMECDASLSVSTTRSTVSIGDEVPISRIIDHIQNQLPTWSIEHLLELWKCLIVISANDRVNLRQFKEATKRWIAKLQQIHTQDSNNNVREGLCKMSDTTVDSMKMDMDRDITEIELRARVRKFDEENIILREDLVRAEELVANLERQRNNLENQLDRYVQKCQQLEKENDEQKYKLNEAIKKERTCAFALQRSRKEHQNLLKQLEAAEIEVQVIPSLKDKMDKISKEKADRVKQIARLQEEFYEREEEYERLKAMMIELEDTSINMKETYEYTIRNLREKNRQLTDENMELQSWSVLNGGVSGERFSISPTPDTNGCCTPYKHTHSTPYKSGQMPLQNSLYAELKASGFTAECSRNESWREVLEEELNQYDAAIPTILEQLDKVVQSFTAMSSSIGVIQFNPPDTEDARAYNIEALKHKVASLLNMTTEEITRRRNIRDTSTQLRADSDATVSWDHFGITSFRGLLTRARECPKAETDLRSIASQRVDDNTDDPFLKVIRANAGLQKRSIIVPIVEELDRIIQNTINSSADRSASGNPRYRSVHTLSSDPRSLQLSSLNAEDMRQTSNCQSSRAISLDSSFAQGDGLTQENRGEKSAEFETYKAPDRENLLHLEGNRSSEMPKVSDILQTDSKALATLEETNPRSFQIPEKSSAAISTTPRRKISVYYRSFDVVAIGDPHEGDQESILEVKRSLSSPSVQEDEKIEAETRESHACYSDSTPKYPFVHSYRNTMCDSDSSNSCSPQKQLRDNLLDDELPVVQPVSRKVYLAPTRLKFPQRIKSELNETVETFDFTNARNRASPDTAKSFETDISRSLLPPVVESDWHEKDDTASLHSSSTFIIDKCETVDGVILESNSCSVNDASPQEHLTSARLISRNQHDPAEIADSEGPHSRTDMRVVDGGQSRVERPVNSQMSSREDTSAGSDSECEPARLGDRCVDGKVATGASEVDRTASAVSLIGSASTTTVPCENTVQNDGKGKSDRDLFTAKQERRQRLVIDRRSLSDDESSDRTMCCCRQRDRPQTAPLIQAQDQFRAFPSLTDARLQESGIAKLSDTEIDDRDNVSELELQKKYTAFSLCLCTDRVTLPQRVEVSLRQRDQSEKNLYCEVQKMQQDIQELAPLCTDRESVERVERVRHRLDMIARCAHRVSCTAETLGAVHQEDRISRAILLGDRYLQLLQSRCEKLAASVAETKRILVENNIVIEENSGELGDDLPRIRYRSGTPANNRMMMARRRASVATMSRPMGGTQDVKKETVRQRNSVSGRVSLSRPSLNYESSKWEIEKMDRTDSSNSIGELRGIFEHIESRRGSREENNNMLRLSQPNNQSIVNCANIENEIWTNTKQETNLGFLSANEDASQDCRPCGKSAQPFRLRSTVMPWRTILWGILIFFLGFYINHAISMVNTCSPLSRWSIEEILKRYVRIKNAAPHPM